MSEVKDIALEISKTWEAMKAKNDEVLTEAKKYGAARAEDKAIIDKMSDGMDLLKKQLDEICLKMERQSLVPPGERAPLDEKALAYRKTFFKWFRSGINELDTAERKLMSEHRIQIQGKALVENTTGLYLVPEDLETEIYRSVAKINHMRSLAEVRPTSRDKIRRRTLSEVSMGWGKLETGAEITESTMTPDQAYIHVEDLYGLTKIGEDELEDTDANLEALIIDSFARARAETEDTAFAIGTGHTYSQPEGIAVDATLIASYKVDLDTADTIVPDDVIDLEYELPEQYLNGASFLMHRKTEKALRLARSSGDGTHFTGQYLWQPSLLAGMPNSFDGYPIYNQGDMKYPADTLAGVNVVFGNPRAGYRILDRKGLAIQRLNELYAEAGLIGFKAHFRVGGGIVRHDAFRVLYNNT